MGADDQRPDGDWLDGLTLRAFGPAPSTTDTVVTLVDLTGTAAAAFRVVRDSVSGSTRVTAEGTDRPYRVIVEETGAAAQGAGTVEVAAL